MKKTIFLFVAILYLTKISACVERTDSIDNLRESLSFYASFDDDLKAKFSLGDPTLYVAATWENRSESMKFYSSEEQLKIFKNKGRYRDALWIDSQDGPVFFYKGENNMPYDLDKWSGTVSFWMRLDPAEDLRHGYSDPIQITPNQWNDGAIFVDFTEENPRNFRFAIFADRNVWDPEKRAWENIPVEERPMVIVEDLPFNRNEWTHIALSFQNFNTNQNNGLVECYINGEKIGVLKGQEQTFTWNPEEVAIWLGYNYRGYFDELSIFNRDLSDEEIKQIYSLKNGIQSILDN